VVGNSGKAWNVYPTAVSLTVVSTTREYAVSYTFPDGDAVGEYAVGKIIEIVRTDLSNDLAYDFVPWSERNEPGNISYNKVPTLRTGRSHAVYTYRSGYDGVWYLGFVSEEPEDQTCEVRFEPVHVPLLQTSSVPVVIPPDFQSLIAVKAAMLGLMQTRAGKQGTQWKELAAHYSVELARFKDYLGTLVSSLKSAKF
jgi:hypothetical protein